ncbi:AI-2E family transporter, partial [Escherichia coli]|nr:AI-2E family transporter [Escherichia coli]
MALALIAGLLEFIPFIGPILSFVPAALIALSQGDATIWWVTGLYLLIQQAENNLLVPLIQQRTVELPPVLGL